MPLAVLIFYTRRPDINPVQFQDHMENTHIPLIQEVMGPHFPETYTMRYVVRVDSGAGDRLGAYGSSRKRAHPDAPVVLVGSPDELGWDSMSELIFKDELQLQQGLAVINSPDGGQRVKEDEALFTVPEKLRVVLMGESKILKQ